MNVDYANTLPLSEILNNLGYSPIKQKGKYHWYHSPFDRKREQQIKINTSTNQWIDPNTQTAGDVIDFVCAYLQSQGVSYNVVDALRFLQNTIGFVRINPVYVTDYNEQDSALTLVKAKPITSNGLIEYLRNRHIPLPIASKHLKEVHIRNTKTNKKIIALGLKNEEKGYAIRTPYMKASIGCRAVTFIRGKVPKPPGIHIFDDAMDYLSIIALNNGQPFHDDAIILNCLSRLDEATAYIRNYGYQKAYTWLDNDEFGKQATQSFDEFFKPQEVLSHFQMNRVYRGFKDANDWHVTKNKPASIT